MWLRLVANYEGDPEVYVIADSWWRTKRVSFENSRVRVAFVDTRW